MRPSIGAAFAAFLIELGHGVFCPYVEPQQAGACDGGHRVSVLS